MPETIEPRVVEFGRHASPGSWFLSKESEIEDQRELLPYAHYLRQAWTELDLNGVLCVDGRPAVYLCEAQRFTPEKKRQHQRFVWNQGLVPLLVFLTPNEVEVHSAVKMPEKEPADGVLFDREASSLIPNLGKIAEALEIAHFVRSIETGQFFQKHADFFPPEETVDRCLLKNLVHTARRLKDAGWDLARAHAFLGRALFVSFLHERQFIKPDYYPARTTCLSGFHRKPDESTFTPPMVIFSEGFTKFAFCRYKVFFQNSLRSITGPEVDADLLRFLTAVLGSRLMQYQAFHSGSSNGIGRDKLHLYESLNLPFPLPDHELVPANADKIIRDVASIFKEVERSDANAAISSPDLASEAWDQVQPLVEEYFSVTEVERILIDDTLKLSQPSIHRPNLDKNIPSLAFPELVDRKRYADTLCDVLNRRARKHDIKISAQGRVSKTLNLIFITVLFAGERKPYSEMSGDDELWTALDRVSEAAKHDNRSFSYLRGFSYFEPDRLHMLKPATMRNWSSTAALNDADAVFEHLVRRNA